MFTRKSGILALVLSALVLGACEDDEGPLQQTPNPTVTIAPSTVPPINAGSTFQLLAVTQNLPAGSVVTWSSSNTTIATVDANGLVTCRTGQAGNVLITATIAATASTPQTQNAVAVTCQAVQGPVVTPSVISISRITDPNGNDVNPGNVQGVVTVIMNVDVPANAGATFVRVRVDGTEACRSTFTGSGTAVVDGAASIPVLVACSFNTAQIGANGAPLFPNGAHNITAEVCKTNTCTGTDIIAQATRPGIVFNNQNAQNVAVTVCPTGTATCRNTDANGLVWETGDVTVTVTPAIFAGGTTSSVQITIVDTQTGLQSTRAGTANANGTFTAVFPKANLPTACNVSVVGTCAANGDPLGSSTASTTDNDGSAGMEGPITVSVTSVVGGNTGPSNIVGGTVRLDNDAPDTEAPDAAASFNNPGWFSTTTSLTGANRVNNLSTLDDEGVNRNTVALQFNTNAAATNTSTGWTAFTDVASLPETITTTELAFRAVICDVLGNCTNTAPVQGGVDRSNPTVTVGAGSAANNAVNPTTEINIIGTDAISGASIVRSRTIGYSVLEVDTNADTDVRCYNANGTLQSTNPTGGAAGCTTSDLTTAAGPGATETNATVIIPADENFYVIEIQTRDVAGNLSTTTITRNALVDAEVPTATIASTTITGTTASISGEVRDNIQVRQYDTRFRFPGILGAGANDDLVPFTQPTAVDATLDPALTGVVAASGSSTLTVRELRVGSNAGAIIQPNAYGFAAIDMANLFGFNGANIAFGGGDGVVNVATVTLVDSTDPICRTATSTCPSSTALEVDIVTNTPGSPTTPFANPVARVYFYYTHPGADGAQGTGDEYLVLIGSTDAAASTVETSSATGVRTFTFAGQTLPASNFTSVQNVPIHAIAVDAQGDAILVSGTTQVN